MSDWLKQFDPGWIRLEHAVKAGLAMSTALAFMLAVMRTLAPAFDVAPAMFSFIVAFVCFMAVSDSRPGPRRATMLLLALPFTLAPFVGGLLRPYPLAAAIMLLALMFVSFYVRRYGVRAAVLGLGAVLAYYFSLLFGATLPAAPWFAAGALAGVAAAYVWQFLIRPYNPQRFVNQAIRAVADALATGQSSAPAATLKRVHSARLAVEAQLPGLLGAPGWDATTVQQLRLHLFTVEQDVRRTAAGAGVQLHMAESMRAVQELLAASQRAQPHPQPAADPTGRTPDQGRASLATATARQAALKATVALGVQATVACGLAMLASSLLHLDRPYWAFWTAFVVVAGPTGESLQKLLLRVLGVAVGSLFGTLLVLLLPDQAAILLPLQILALMLALYTRVINYAWMAFWITTFVALLYSVEGVPPATLLVERPLNTLIGAAIAALVVLFVLPVREQGKFRTRLSTFLAAVDAYLGALVGAHGALTAAADAAALQTAAGYEAVAQTFPALALETAPLAYLQGAQGWQSAAVSDLYAGVECFAALAAQGAPAPAQAAPDQASPADAAGAPAADPAGDLQTLVCTVQANLQAVQRQAALAHGAEAQPPAWQPLPPPAGAAPTQAAAACLARVNQALLTLGEALE